ncbi:MAG: gephyrin-like molybdotransferase Glp [candidate division Zixibacteria bacterium]
MISAEKALQIVLDHTRTLEPSEVPLLSSIDMVLADDIIAAEDYPPFDKSTIDGFAIRSAEIARSDRAKPTTLILDGDIKVGDCWDKPLVSGHAVKVAAGAPLPEGADAVVSGDYAVRESSKKVKIYKSEKPGEHIIIRGDDVEKSSVILPKGRIVNAADIGLLAATGAGPIPCYRKPRICFFASGNDLISPLAPAEAGKIRASAYYTLQIQLQRYGADPVDLGILQLDPDEIKTNIEKGQCCDMMIITSGASGGDFDYLKAILQKYGLDLKFWRVAIRPGKPFVFGMFDSMPVFGLSDNLLSSMVVLEHFVRPSIMKMQGKSEDRRMEVKARLEKDIRGGNGITCFVRAEVRLTDDGFVATPLGMRTSYLAKAFLTANGFITLPPHIPGFGAGEMVKVQIIGDNIAMN